MVAVIGFTCILCGFLLLYPVLTGVVVQEIRYFLRSSSQKEVVPPARVAELPDKPATEMPVDSDFGIIIPKIGANEPVVPNVDPYSEAVYQSALSQGIAHASGTVYPGDIGRMFLFAHSAENAWFAARYNAAFYLLPKLEPGDPIYVYKNGIRYTYFVTGAEIVSEDAIEYLEYTSSDEKELVLMTCWPAGTTFQRYLVFARIIP